MGKPTTSTRTKLLALHQALRNHHRATGTVGQPIQRKKWNQILLVCTGNISEQSAYNSTYYLEALGLVEQVPGEGVTVLDRDPIDAVES